MRIALICVHMGRSRSGLPRATVVTCPTCVFGAGHVDLGPPNLSGKQIEPYPEISREEGRTPSEDLNPGAATVPDSTASALVHQESAALWTPDSLHQL